MRKGSAQVIIILVLLSIVILGVLYFFQIQNKKTSQKEPVNDKMSASPSPRTIGETCQQYGISILPEDFLDTYTSGEGDTPTSIVKTNFGNTSRLSEFMTINQGLHFATDSALPIGSKVALPPKEVSLTSGSLFAARGQLKRVVDQTYWITTRTENSDQGDYPLNINSRTLLVKKPLVGDCVKAVLQQGGDFQVLYITTY